MGVNSYFTIYLDWCRAWSYDFHNPDMCSKLCSWISWIWNFPQVVWQDRTCPFSEFNSDGVLYNSRDLLLLSLYHWKPFLYILLYRNHYFSKSNEKIICCLGSSNLALLFMKSRWIWFFVAKSEIVSLEILFFFALIRKVAH